MKTWSLIIASVTAASLSAQTDSTRMGTQGSMGTHDEHKGPQKTATETQDPKSETEGSWIAINGSVKSVGNDQFVLDHGDGTITVKLQPEGKIDGEHKFIENEKVRVYGVIDENFFLSTTILARAVYVESLSTYVYRTDGVDEFLEVSTPVIESGTVVHGTVAKVEDGKVTLDEGDRMITVDTSILTKDEDPNTMDNATGLAEGDRITAVGVMDKDFWTGRTFRATSMMQLDGEGSETEGEMQGSDRDY